MLDHEDFLVLKEAPCAFLDEDNYCTVYDARPNACREYPHTNRKKFRQLLDLTLENTLVCPAAFKIVRKLRETYKDAAKAKPKY